MAKVKIVTDSTAYLTPELVLKHDLRVVHLNVSFGEKIYVEGIDITNDEFYSWLQSKPLPKTSHPSVGDFAKVYAELIKDGSPVLSIHVSGKLSNTVDAARAAARELSGAQIEVMDSQLTAMALGLVVLAAARAADEGQSLAEIKRATEELIKNVHFLFVVNNMDYLRKSGRISRAVALVDAIFKTSPVLCLKGGRIEALTRVRGKSKALNRVLEMMDERIPRGMPIHVAITHAHAFEEAVAIEKEVRARFNCRQVYFSELGPVVGTDVGPGAVGVAFYSDTGPAATPVAQAWNTNATTVPAPGTVSQGSLASHQQAK